MPQNTPMKRQFTTIDGRTVMSNLPQHWGGNDWAITGVDNPLPVGNYVQTEAGVWIPQKGSDDGAADVRLTGSNLEEIHNLQETIELLPGESFRPIDGVKINSNYVVIGVFVDTVARIRVDFYDRRYDSGPFYLMNTLTPLEGSFTSFALYKTRTNTKFNTIAITNVNQSNPALVRDLFVIGVME